MAVLLTPRYLLALVPATALVAVLTGLPTDVLPNPWFSRMTPVRTTDLVLWPLTSLAAGAVLATYALGRPSASQRPLGAGLGGGVLGAFAVGCPICNKLVVLLLGLSGALTFWEPLQPVVGGLAVLLALAGLRARVRVLRRGCPAPSVRPTLIEGYRAASAAALPVPHSGGCVRKPSASSDFPNSGARKAL